MDTVSNLTFLLKAVNFRERALQRSLVARIYYKVRTHSVIFFLLTCVYGVFLLVNYLLNGQEDKSASS